MNKLLLILGLISTNSFSQTTYFKSYKIPFNTNEYMQLGLGFEPTSVEHQFKSKTCIKKETDNIYTNNEVDFSYQSTFTSDDFSLTEYLKTSMNSTFEGSFEVFNFTATSNIKYENSFNLQKNEVALIIKAQETGAFDQLSDYELKDEFKTLLTTDVDSFIEKCGTHLLIKKNREAKIFVIVKFSLSDKELTELMEYKMSASGDILDLFKVSGNLNLEKMFEKKIKDMSYSIEVASEGMLNASSAADIKGEIQAKVTGAELINGFINSIKTSISTAVAKRENKGIVSNYIAVPYQGLNLEFIELNSREQALMQRNIHIFKKNKQILIELAGVEPMFMTASLEEYFQAAERILSLKNQEIKDKRKECMDGKFESCLFRAILTPTAKAISNAVDTIEIYPTCVYDNEGVLEKYRINMSLRLYNPEFFFKIEMNYANSTKQQSINYNKLSLNNLVVLGGVKSTFSYINEYLFEEKLSIPGQNNDLTREKYSRIKEQYETNKLEIGVYSNTFGDNTKVNFFQKVYYPSKASFCEYKKGDK